MFARTRITPVITLLLFAVAGFVGVSQPSPRRLLEIHYVDVEGGAATLIVTPAGESVLIDAGWPGFDGRDATRIQRAMQKAGIRSIDHLVTTHYHTDHYGGVPQLAAAVRIAKFYDHGPMTSLVEDPDFAKKYAAYRAAARNKTITLKPGDEIKLRRAAGTPPIKLRCLASHGVTINETRGGGKANQECQSAILKPDDPSDNARSVVLWLRYGEFDFFDAGDLTWNIEHRLFCPLNPLGEVDLYQVTHHGLNSSNNPLVMTSLQPTVAIMNNGPRKGGHPETVRWLRDLPSLKALYQMHVNTQSTAAENAHPDFIANLSQPTDDANPIMVAIDSAAGAFTVTNGRTGVSQSYPIK